MQCAGYRAPEATAWNRHKEAQKRRRRRKLEGTYLHLDRLAAGPSRWERGEEWGDISFIRAGSFL